MRIIYYMRMFIVLFNILMQHGQMCAALFTILIKDAKFAGSCNRGCCSAAERNNTLASATEVDGY